MENPENQENQENPPPGLGLGLEVEGLPGLFYLPNLGLDGRNWDQKKPMELGDFCYITRVKAVLASDEIEWRRQDAVTIAARGEAALAELDAFNAACEAGLAISAEVFFVVRALRSVRAGWIDCIWGVEKEFRRLQHTLGLSPDVSLGWIWERIQISILTGNYYLACNILFFECLSPVSNRWCCPHAYEFKIHGGNTDWSRRMISEAFAVLWEDGELEAMEQFLSRSIKDFPGELRLRGDEAAVHAAVVKCCKLEYHWTLKVLLDMFQPDLKKIGGDLLFTACCAGVEVAKLIVRQCGFTEHSPSDVITALISRIANEGLDRSYLYRMADWLTKTFPDSAAEMRAAAADVFEQFERLEERFDND